MPRIEIETPGPDNRLPNSGWGTIVKMNGQEVPEVRSIQVEIGLDHPVTARMEVLASDKFTFAADVDLHVTLVAMEGCELVETANHRGDRSFRVEKRT